MAYLTFSDSTKDFIVPMFLTKKKEKTIPRDPKVYTNRCAPVRMVCSGEVCKQNRRLNIHGRWLIRSMQLKNRFAWCWYNFEYQFLTSITRCQFFYTKYCGAICTVRLHCQSKISHMDLLPFISQNHIYRDLKKKRVEESREMHQSMLSMWTQREGAVFRNLSFPNLIRTPKIGHGPN